MTAFPSADRSTTGPATRYNRQASVQAVSCDGFGFDVSFHVDGGIVCSLLSAAIGRRYAHLALYLDGSCAAPTLAADHDVGSESAVACGMLSDLLHAVPWAQAYAAGAGVACAFGKPLGAWIESKSERRAAEAVIRDGRCLAFTRHRFPVPDDWSAAACSSGDPGFSTLPVGRSPVRSFASCRAALAGYPQESVGQVIAVRGMSCVHAREVYLRNQGDQHVPLAQGQVSQIGAFACHVYQDLTPPGPSDTWVRILCSHEAQAFRLEYGV